MLSELPTKMGAPSIGQWCVRACSLYIACCTCERNERVLHSYRAVVHSLIRA